MLKKQIQKLLSKILRPAFIGVAITAILAVNIGYIAASFISAQPTLAQVNCDAFDPTSPKTYASRIYVDKSVAPADRSYAIGAANVNGPDTQEIALNEELNVYAEVTLPATFTECATTANLDNAFKFEVYNAAGKIINGLRTNAKISKAGDQVKFYSEGMKNSDWNQYSVRGSSAPLPAYVYFCRASGCATTDVNGNDYIERFNIKINPTPATAAVVQPPSSALLSGTGSSSDPNAKKKAEDVTFRFRQDGAQGLRSKYRVLLDEKDPYNKLVFGSNGLEKIYVDWANDASKLTPSNQLVIPLKNSQIGADPYFKYVRVGLNYFDTKIENNGCKSTTFEEDCSGVIFTKKYESLNGKESVQQPTIPSGFDPVLYNAAWKSKVQDKAVGEGQPLGTVEFRVIPVIWAKSGVVIDDWYSYVYASQAVKFTVEVYKTEADIKKACENDAAVTDKSICSDPQKMRYQVGEIVDVTTGTNQKSGSETQSLYDFIIRVISAIVIFLTTQIYKIFAYFIVPVLNALLQVKPYQDIFVNIIYPGWLILRNLANIFFIISLLVVGLRILFQQSAASVAAGFIRRLLIMALLVNFSLVISQGIVGIADTVQSQFMPQNTKIIEALGQKLMVEPIQSFRVAVSPDGTDSGSLKGDQTIADTAKPIILLVLAVAAFFSFIAVAAFLAIRLVMLLILYMVSPIAYIGFVMEDTKKYASQWWSEFIKYAFLTPILVFFLNIAALVAVLFSGKDGNVIKLEGTSGDLVAGGLTIVTHFIVLLFIYAGMIIATKSGTIGSKAVVGYAKKGFDALTTRPAKWAANTAADLAKGAAQDQYTRRIKGGLFDPMAFKQAWKDSNERKNSKLMNDRLARAEGRLSPTSIINNPLRSAKYLATGGRFGGGKLLSEKERLEEEAGIMNDSDRADLTNDLATAHMTEAEMKQESDLMNSGKMSFETAQAVVDRLDAKAKAHEAKRDELLDDAREATAKGRTAEAASKTAQAGAEDRQRILADRSKTDLESQLTRARGLGSDGVTIGTGLKAKIGIEFNFDEVKDELNKTVSKLEDESKQIEQRLDHDDELRNKYNYGPGGATMDATRRAQLEKGIEAYSDKINSRELPLSMAQREARLARERAHDKSIEELDGEELEVHFENALKDNNSDLAIAIAKKIAKEGDFDQLLEHSKDKNGDAYKNNIEGFQKFLTEKLGKIAPTVRMQVGSEISSIAQKNGNYAIGKATKVGPDKSLSWRSGTDHNTKIDNILRGKKPEDMVKAKKFEITRQKASGGHELYKGAVENFNKMNDAKLGKLKEQMSSKLANHIIKSTNFLDIKNDAVRAAIESAAGK